MNIMKNKIQLQLNELSFHLLTVIVEDAIVVLKCPTNPEMSSFVKIVDLVLSLSLFN